MTVEKNGSNLRLNIKAGGRLLVNGALLIFREGDSRVHLLVKTPSARVVADKMVMLSEEATTPIKQLYLAVQTAYAGGTQAERVEAVAHTHQLIEELKPGASVDFASVLEQIDRVTIHLNDHEWYQALKTLYRYMNPRETAGVLAAATETV